MYSGHKAYTTYAIAATCTIRRTPEVSGYSEAQLLSNQGAGWREGKRLGREGVSPRATLILLSWSYTYLTVGHPVEADITPWWYLCVCSLQIQLKMPPQTSTSHSASKRKISWMPSFSNSDSICLRSMHNITCEINTSFLESYSV